MKGKATMSDPTGRIIDLSVGDKLGMGECKAEVDKTLYIKVQLKGKVEFGPPRLREVLTEKTRLYMRAKAHFLAGRDVPDELKAQDKLLTDELVVLLMPILPGMVIEDTQWQLTDYISAEEEAILTAPEG